MVFAVGTSSVASAASTVTITASGGGVYQLQGAGVESAAAMDITITYDAASLASPRVVQGTLISGALMAVNDTVQGVIRIGIIRTTPVTGSGQIATLTFTGTGDATAIINLKASFTTIDGKPLPVLAQISKPAEVVADKTATDVAAQGGQGANTSTVTTISNSSPQAPAAVVRTPVYGPAGGIVVEPRTNDGVVTAGTATALDPVVEPVTAKAAVEARGVTVSLETSGKKTYTYKSVLDRFKEYKGARTAKAYVSLFQQGTTTWVRQAPTVQLADGVATVKVFITIPAGGGVAPEYALLNARLVSVRRDNDRDDTWVLEACPEKGGYEARLIISRGAEMIVFPLTIAPRLDLQKKGQARLSEKDLDRYLSGARQDVNKDDKNDYLDDYIYTANVLSQQISASSGNSKK